MKLLLFCFIVAVLSLGQAHSRPPYYPLTPKQLLDALPKPAGWSLLESSGRTTRGENLMTFARRSMEKTVEVDGEQITYTMRFDVKDTGGVSAELEEINSMTPANDPDLIVRRSGGQTVITMLDEEYPPFHRTHIFDRFIISLESNLPQEEVESFLLPSSYPRLRNAPEKAVPEDMRNYQEIFFNELSAADNKVRNQTFMSSEDIAAAAEEMAASDPELLTGAEEDALLEQELQKLEQEEDTGAGAEKTEE